MIPTYTDEDLARIFPCAAHGSCLQRQEKWQQEYGRIAQLADELEKLEGFIYMTDWVRGVSMDDVEAAYANPCGTAACIAGKAGLMSVFHARGYKWDGFGFTTRPEVFFGRRVYYSIFVGTWAQDNIHTPQQAALVLRDFLQWFTLEAWWAQVNWTPSDQLCDEITALRPTEKVFPVSHLKTVWASARYAGEDSRWHHYLLEE